MYQKVTVGEKIKIARMKKGWSQEELGKKVGIQRATIGKYERGAVTNIKRAVLQKLADVLELRGSDLIFDDSYEQELQTRILLDDSVMDMLNDYFSLSRDQRKGIREMIAALAQKNEKGN